MYLNRLVSDRSASWRQTNDNAASVAGAVVAFDPSFFLDLIDPIGDRARAQQRLLIDIGRAQFVRLAQICGGPGVG